MKSLLLPLLAVLALPTAVNANLKNEYYEEKSSRKQYLDTCKKLSAKAQFGKYWFKVYYIENQNVYLAMTKVSNCEWGHVGIINQNFKISACDHPAGSHRCNSDDNRDKYQETVTSYFTYGEG